MRRLIATAALLLALVGPAAGQVPLPTLPGMGAVQGSGPATPAPPAEAPATAPAGGHETQALIDLLENDTSRKALIDHLKTTVAERSPPAAGSPIHGPTDAADAASSTAAANHSGRARPTSGDAAVAEAENAAPAHQTASIGEEIVTGVPELLRDILRGARQDLSVLRATARRLGGLSRFDEAVLAPDLKALLIALCTSLGVIALAGLIVRPLRRRIDTAAAATTSLIRKTVLTVATILIDLAVLVGGMLVAAVTVALWVGSQLSPNVVNLLQALLTAGTFIIILRGIFRPATPLLRPLPMSTATARYWTWQLGTVVTLVVVGETFVAPLISSAVSPITARASLVTLYVVALLYLIFLVIRNRAEPGRYYARETELHGQSALYAVLAALTPWWHFLVVPYLLLLLHRAMTSGRPAVPLLTSVAHLTISAALGILVVRILNRLARRGVRLSPGLRQAMPNLEERLESFMPPFLVFLRNVVVVLWVILALQAVGALRLGDWIEGRFGVDILGAATSLIVVVLICFVLWLALSAWVDFRLSPGDREPTAREKTLLALARNAGMVAILAVGLTYALSSIGVSVAPLLASAGVVGLAIGFGSQKLVQDIITGVFIQFENAINVGDVVEAGGKIGAVEKLTIRSVSLRDVAGVFHVIPFSSVDSVSNYMKGFSYHVADIGIAYREDIDAAKVEMLAAYDDLTADMQWETKLVGGLEWFGVESLGDSSVVLRARLKTRPGEQWAVGRAYTEIVKKRFDRAGIEIPYPHLTLWFGAARDGTAPPAHLILSERAAQTEPTRHATASRQTIDPAGPTDADDADQP